MNILTARFYKHNADVFVFESVLPVKFSVYVLFVFFMPIIIFVPVMISLQCGFTFTSAAGCDILLGAVPNTHISKVWKKGCVSQGVSIAAQ